MIRLSDVLAINPVLINRKLLKGKEGLWGEGVAFQAAAQSSGSEKKCWGLKHLSANSAYTTSLLCDVGQVILPLCAS